MSGSAAAPCEVTIVANDVGSVGGMERQLAELVLGLRRRGHPVTVIAWTCELPADAGVRFIPVAGPRKPFLIGYFSFMALGSLAVRRHARGVVQSTGAIVLNRVDAIAIHCCHQVYRQAPARPGRLAALYVRALGLMKRAGERVCFRINRDAVYVCVSDGVADEVREHFPSLAQVTTIHNGVDTDEFAPHAHDEQVSRLRSEIAVAPGRLVAVFVARGWGHKGLGAVIEALALAPEWDLVVAGEGDRATYEALARSRGVSEAVHWTGVVRDIHLIYGLADAFVLPSSYETFSLVTFEAAASGVPVLATPVSGVRELISDGANGYLITADPRAIASRLTELGADPQLRAELGRAARAAALHFSWERMLSEHDALYARLAASA